MGELPERRAWRIADYKDGCNIEQVERHDEVIDWFFDAGTRLRAALVNTGGAQAYRA